MGITQTTWSLLQRPLSNLGRIFFSFLLIIGLFCAQVIVLAPASQASKNGMEVRDNKFAVGFTYLDEGISKICSSVLISPYVLVTARHCAQSDSGVPGTNYELTPPGVSLEAALDPRIRTPKVVKTVIPQPSDYSLGGKGGDIAFLILDIPFDSFAILPVATAQEIESLQEGSVIQGFGFGAVFETGAPYSPFVRRYPLSWKGSVQSANDPAMYELSHPETAGCSGDSGGPVTLAHGDGRQVVIGVVHGAADVNNNCGGKSGDGLYRLSFTLIHPYLPLVSEYLNLEVPAKKSIICIKGSKRVKVTAFDPWCPTGYKKAKTITCVKGSQTKKVTALNPRCPSGYVRK